MLWELGYLKCLGSGMKVKREVGFPGCHGLSNPGHWVNCSACASLVFLALKPEKWAWFSLTALRERARTFILAVMIEERHNLWGEGTSYIRIRYYISYLNEIYEKWIIMQKFVMNTSKLSWRLLNSIEYFLSQCTVAILTFASFTSHSTFWS